MQRHCRRFFRTSRTVVTGQVSNQQCLKMIGTQDTQHLQDCVDMRSCASGNSLSSILTNLVSHYLHLGWFIVSLSLAVISSTVMGILFCNLSFNLTGWEHQFYAWRSVYASACCIICGVALKGALQTLTSTPKLRKERLCSVAAWEMQTRDEGIKVWMRAGTSTQMFANYKQKYVNISKWKPPVSL